MSRNHVPEEHALFEPELREDPVKNRRRCLGRPAAGYLPFGGERNPAHARAAVAGRLTHEEDWRLPARGQVSAQAVAQECRPLSMPVEVERRSDSRLGEGRHEGARSSVGKRPGRHAGRSLTLVIRRRLVVHGYVQGVFFRDTMRQLAVQHGVSGWVRNNPDGSVEAIVEGDPDAVDRLLAFARQGPRGAEVDRVEVGEEEPEGLSGFAVR
jgi:acylphosphatase